MYIYNFFLETLFLVKKKNLALNTANRHAYCAKGSVPLLIGTPLFESNNVGVGDGELSQI